MRHKIISFKGQSILKKKKKVNTIVYSFIKRTSYHWKNSKTAKTTSLCPEFSCITYWTSPIKDMAGKGIPLSCQWPRGNLCFWPTQGWEHVLVAAVSVKPCRQGSSLSAHSQPEVILSCHQQEAHSPSGKRHAAPWGTATHPGFELCCYTTCPHFWNEEEKGFCCSTSG